MSRSLLIVDDEKNTREGLSTALEDEYDVYLANHAEEAFRILESQEIDLVLTDLRMAGKSGMRVIDHCLQLSNHPACIMMTAYGDVPTAVEAMKRGAFDFLTKPLNLEHLEAILRRTLKEKEQKPDPTAKTASEASSAHQESSTMLTKTVGKKSKQNTTQSNPGQTIISRSPKMQAVLEQVEQVAPARSSVMLHGETGTGKELVAQLIHQSSPRAEQPFIPVHCAAIAANLLESELFGHEKGAFTGAVERRIGRFEAAHDGSLFLDEIGEIDTSTQVKLLRFLETHRFERLGSIKPIQVDIRLICATHRNLQQMIHDGEFREDLFYRLNVVPLQLPALRERREDIPHLIFHYIEQYSQENNLPPIQITDKAMEHLCAYYWPGNIRELRNYCENIVVMRRGNKLNEYDLDQRFKLEADDFSNDSDPVDAQAPPQHLLEKSNTTPSLSREENEKKILREALQKSAGNRTRAAKLMGISRRTLHRKLERWPELDVE